MRPTAAFLAVPLLFATPLACQQQAAGDSTRAELVRALDAARASVAQLARALERYDSARPTPAPRPDPAPQPGAVSQPVSQPTPVPQPAGPGLVHADDFERDEVQLEGAAFKWSGPAWVVTSTERARSGRKSLKFRFGDMGSTPVTEQSRAQLNFSFAPASEVWIEWYAYHPDGTEGIPGVGAFEHGKDTPDNNKLLRVYADGNYSKAPEWGASTVGNANGGGGNSRVRVDHFAPSDSWTPRGPRNTMPVFLDLQTDRGRWVQVRFHARKATPGKADGVIRMWKDGKLIVDATGLALSDRTGSHDHFSAGYLYGAANSGFPRHTAVYVDDFTLYRSDPGWR